ncbi:hemolysin family protein [Marinibaculum pumilum]|uniref:Hemolysin family protein n=1 Tax=Marinibaculum pumilum TaxID=1766165 RepID=A0ABV7L601_9PROT
MTDASGWSPGGKDEETGANGARPGEAGQGDGRAGEPGYESGGGAGLGARILELLRGVSGSVRRDEDLRRSLEGLLDESETGSANAADYGEAELIRNALTVGSKDLYDVMVPRADIRAIDAGSSLSETVAELREAAHSRMPVYRDSLDDVIGMLHIKDMLQYWGREDATFDMSKVVRRVLYAPPSMRVLDLLLEMRATRVHMAMVVDEYGGVDGLVTIEDLVEQVVGEIEDEHDKVARPMIVERPDGSLDVDARTELEELEDRVGLDLLDDDRDEDVDTVGGLIFELSGRVPQRGEVVEHDSGLRFEILDADPRKIKRVRLTGEGLAVAGRPDISAGGGA